MINSYRLTLLLNPNVEEKKRQQILDDVKKQFTKLEKEEEWGKRNLAYEIDHHKTAYYVHYEFQAEPEKIPSLDRMIKMNEDVLRYLILKKDKK